MNTTETKKIIAILCGAGGKGNLTEMTIPVWHEALKDLDYPDVEAAAMTWATTRKYWPFPVEIRTLALRSTLNLAADAYDAWTRVQTMHRKNQRPDVLDYATREALRKVGGLPALILADDPTWIRRDFIAAYDGAVQEAITPATIAALRDGSTTLKGLPTNATPEHQGPLQRESENYVDTGNRIVIVDNDTTVGEYATGKPRRRIGDSIGKRVRDD
jgi:hypothetical protein